ncbi:DNA/RNA helicase domain-containing protein [Actinoplanes teichomyceticus]|uniref:AAA+ ATPase domain-containing protein n=1 Tax=Actinoplanes teichomyceticus TaxID=1867 RepID=A0A561WB65_ACTTI|nr:DNA/RNA helicase domain-containing protein [Actinoplanes teichomyceticus]TWG21093.1 hypothetical protein FHX34_103623 [Actinoplanes teichomyceticus]GIF14913.1 ATP-binding protein [Actinoplanes teichomyceticus]
MTRGGTTGSVTFHGSTSPRRDRYAASVRDFHAATRPGAIDTLVERLAGAVLSDRRRDIGEIGSWTASLPALADILHAAGLHDSWIALEYRPYQAGWSRADAVIAGTRANGRAAYLVVELKQWQQATWNAVDECVTGTGARYERDRGLAHPYHQARDYSQFIRNFTDGMHDENEVAIAAAAYLHNATERSIETLRTAGLDEAEATFSGDPEGRRRFIAFLKAFFASDGTGAEAWEDLCWAPYRQGPSILEAATRIFTDRTVYPLTDEQRNAFSYIQKKVSDALDPQADREQAIIVVKGGPGTGKTWIAMHLLGANANAGRQVSYSTNSTALRNALQKGAGFNKHLGTEYAAKLITSARIYDDFATRTKLDVLIVDEAQRLTEWNVPTGHQNRKDRQEYLEKRRITQLFELKKSAKVLVLFIGEDQASTYKDFVTIAHAEEIAARTGADFKVFELTEQHRSGGSQAFEAWVDALLDGEPTVWHDEDSFKVRVVDSPEALEDAVLGDAADGDGRLVAGFCWTWLNTEARTLGELPFDIKIGDWKKHWNLRKPMGGYPKDDDWARNPKGAAQVGSIFTAQGFEFPRVGVIMGPDLTWDAASGRMTVHMDACRYSKLVQEHGDTPTGDARIRNQYRVLLTRAMSSVVLYSTDPDTRALLKRIVNPAGPLTESSDGNRTPG